MLLWFMSKMKFHLMVLWEDYWKKINCSEIDVEVVPVYMDKTIKNFVDFSYPYKLEDFTFVTRQPVYKTKIFGIFQAFSFPVWISIILFLIAISIVSHTMMKKKYNFSRITFHVFAVPMWQSSLVTRSSLGEKLIVYTWVVGAMVLCLPYESVFIVSLCSPRH